VSDMPNDCPYCERCFDTKQGLSQHTRGSHDGKSWIPREELVELYVERKRLPKQIAERYDVSAKTILRTLERYGIEKRDPNELMKQALRKKPPQLQTEPRGYVVVRNKHEGDKCKIYLHRLLAVAEYGIDAVENMDDHHKNGIRWDNRPKNIQLVDKSTHGTHHAHERWGNETTLG